MISVRQRALKVFGRELDDLRQCHVGHLSRRFAENPVLRPAIDGSFESFGAWADDVDVDVLFHVGT